MDIEEDSPVVRREVLNIKFKDGRTFQTHFLYIDLNKSYGEILKDIGSAFGYEEGKFDVLIRRQFVTPVNYIEMFKESHKEGNCWVRGNP